MEFKNGARIEYANTAIYTAKLNPDGTDDPSGYGGIVKVDNTTFYNNYSSILIKNYYNPFGAPQTNQSTISNSTFEVDKPYYDMVETPPGFINLTLVTNVKIQNNVFKNTCTTTTITNKNYGIYSTDASYYVSNNNQFNSLKYGVKSMNTIPSFTPTIDHCTFSQCYRGIYLSGVTNPTVTFNTMEVPSDNNNCYGLYLDNCPTFNVQENTFAGKGENRNGDFGIIVNNSGDNVNSLYNNTFNYMNVGIQAQNRNRGTNVFTGLKISCNDFANCPNDISVVRNITASGLGISVYQGTSGTDPSFPAGNQFDHVGNDYIYSITNNSINYYHHIPSSNPRVLPQNTIGNIILPTPEAYWTNKLTSCPPNISENMDNIGILKSTIIASDMQVSELKTQLQTLIDGGKTTMLEMQVENSQPPQALQLRNKLMSKSPYLSDTVMISAIENEDGLPPSMLTQVLVANPHSAKSPELLDIIDNREIPLTEYMKTQILLGKNRTSAKEITEANLSYYLAQRELAYDKIERIYKNDTLHPWAQDSLFALLGNRHNLQSKYELVFYKIANNQIEDALALMNNISNNFVMDENQGEEYADYITLVNIYTSLKQNDKTWKDMNNMQKQALQSLAGKQRNCADIYAVNILRLTDSLQYEEPIILPGEGDLIFAIGNHPQQQQQSEQLLINSIGNTTTTFNVYPNPAKDFIMVEYSLTEDINNACIEIVDLTGKKIKHIVLSSNQKQLVIDSKGMKNGIYYLYLTNDGAVVKQSKITIIN